MFLRATDPLPLEELRLRTFDTFQVLSPRDAEERPVVIVDIDEPSLRALGQWPWPRTRVADIITRLTELGALVIGFDVVFAEADRLSPQLAADAFRDLDETTRSKLRNLPSNDQVMAEAMRRSKVVVGETGLPIPVPQANLQPATAGVAALGGDPAPFLFSFPGLLQNIPVLEQAAAGRGLFSIRTERDGIVRRVPMVLSAQGNIMPSLSFEMLRVVTGAQAILIRMDEAGIKGVAVPGLEMDLLRRRVLVRGGEVRLTSREFQILEVLVRNAGKIVTRTMLLEAVWDYRFDPQTNIVDQHVSRLRQKLGDEGASSTIETVRGVGYRVRG